jgi:hypothetical protein
LGGWKYRNSYNGVREKLPLEIIAGVSQELENVPIRWHLTLENLQQWNIAFSNQLELLLHWRINRREGSFVNNAFATCHRRSGAFPKKILIRLGYNFRRAEELRLESSVFFGISLGFGLKLNKLKFNIPILGTH